jgi:hypothetical protein
MIRQRPRGETSLSQATYGHERPKYSPSSPETQLVAEQDLARDCAKARRRNKLSAAGRYGDVLIELGLLKE